MCCRQLALLSFILIVAASLGACVCLLQTRSGSSCSGGGSGSVCGSGSFCGSGCGSGCSHWVHRSGRLLLLLLLLLWRRLLLLLWRRRLLLLWRRLLLLLLLHWIRRLRRLLLRQLLLRLCAARCRLLHDCHEAVYHSSLACCVGTHSADRRCRGWVTGGRTQRCWCCHSATCSVLRHCAWTSRDGALLSLISASVHWRHSGRRRRRCRRSRCGVAAGTLLGSLQQVLGHRL
jgi:hypothetical protein